MTTQNYTGTYDLDTAHSSVGFTVRHAMVTKVRGEFTDFTASLTANQDNPAELGRVVLVSGKGSGEVSELAADLGHHCVTHGEADGGVGGVKVVGAGVVLRGHRGWAPCSNVTS